ncbi:MAG TPA: hypothetical protein VFZ48_05375 [Candidatus Saccharimonadales bacterium]
MENTLSAILNDESARSSEAVQNQLAEEASVGAPWYDHEAN